MNWFVDFLGFFPLGVLFVLTLVVSIGQVELGSALARLALRRSHKKEPEGPVGSSVGALLGLLAFMLAFTFGMAATRFETRRQLVLDEANALGTTYLRAEMLPPAEGEEIKRLLREYVDVRLGISIENYEDVLKQSADLQRRLWSQAKLLVGEEMDGEVRSLFIDSLNQVIELHQSRQTVGLLYRVPGTVWAALYLLSCLAMMSVGYQIGMSGVTRLRGMPIVAAAFALVILMIADIDRPGEGMMRVSQKPIADVRQTMKP